MYFPGKDFVRITPEQAGIPSAAIERALDAIVSDGKEIHSMLILKDGALAFEQYFAPYDAATAHAMYSCSKTFTSMLIGIAEGKGLLSIKDKVLDYFPEVHVAEPNDNLRAMTLRDLLVMGSGHGEDTFAGMMASENWPEKFLNQIVDHTPGTHFVYNTGATYMLSAVLTKVTGRTAFDLAKEWIFAKIGIEPEKWLTCPNGISQGGTGLFVKPTDMARLGLLISNEGCWNGEQIIPAEYIRQAREKQIDNSITGNPNPNWTAGYGYQMWRCAFGAFRADGMGGQYIVMLPERGLVFVFTSALGSDIGYPLDVISDILLPEISDEPLPENAGALESLRKNGAALACYGEAETAAMEVAPQRWTIEENGFGVKGICLSPEKLVIELEDRAVECPYGWGKPAICNQPQRLFFGHPSAIHTMAFEENGELCFRIHQHQEPCTYVLRLACDGDKLRARVTCTIDDEVVCWQGKRA